MGCILFVAALVLLLGLGVVETPGDGALLLTIVVAVAVWLVAFRSGWNSAVGQRESDDVAAVRNRAERDRR